MNNELNTQDVHGKIVLLRVDINVPMQGNQVTDDTRIQRVLPTITGLCERGAKVVLLSHFGRPKGQRNEAMSLVNVADALRERLKPVSLKFVDDCVGAEVEQAIAEMNNGDVLLCENLRFHAGEEAGDADFAHKLAALGDVYVNDAFSCSHRAHASIAGIPQHLPAFFGDAMVQELTMLESVFATPKPPVAALVGGSKVSTKMALLENLIARMDMLMIGGGMANTFLYAQGHDIGASLCEKDLKELALTIMNKAADAGCQLLLPEDVTVAQEFSAHAPCRIVGVEEIGANEMALDIGSKTVERWSQAIREANTLVWNGPVGAFEMAPFDNGSVSLARVIAAQTQVGQLVSVAGGGDTVAALSHAGLSDAMTYVSTAGGAFLEWLEGKTLPGVEAIQTSNDAPMQAASR